MFCLGKRCYKNLKQCGKAASYSMRVSHVAVDNLRPYCCTKCGYYHLTEAPFVAGFSDGIKQPQQVAQIRSIFKKNKSLQVAPKLKHSMKKIGPKTRLTSLELCETIINHETLPRTSC